MRVRQNIREYGKKHSHKRKSSNVRQYSCDRLGDDVSAGSVEQELVARVRGVGDDAWMGSPGVRSCKSLRRLPFQVQLRDTGLIYKEVSQDSITKGQSGRGAVVQIRAFLRSHKMTDICTNMEVDVVLPSSILRISKQSRTARRPLQEPIPAYR